MSSTPVARRTLAVAALGTFLSLMVFTAPLATINATATSLDAGVAGRTWVLSSMSVGLAAALLVAGAVADDVGRRRTFIVGMAVLAAGSLLASVAPHVLLFVLARVVEGVGAAAVIAASLGIIAHAFAPGPERAAASGVWGASLGAGIAAGPLLTAGLDRYADWRLAYVVFAAFAVVLGVAAQVVAEESRSVRPERNEVSNEALGGQHDALHRIGRPYARLDRRARGHVRAQLVAQLAEERSDVIHDVAPVGTAQRPVSRQRREHVYEIQRSAIGEHRQRELSGAHTRRRKVHADHDPSRQGCEAGWHRQHGARPRTKHLHCAFATDDPIQPLMRRRANDHECGRTLARDGGNLVGNGAEPDVHCRWRDSA